MENRRGALKVLTTLLGAVVGVIVAIPGLRLLAHPLRKKTTSGGDEPLRVASPGELVPGRPLRVDVVGSRTDAWVREDGVKLGACWLVREKGGAVRAFSTVCPHLGCGIDWNQETGQFDCPCHGSSFDASGRRVKGPSPRDMDELGVVVSERDVLVRYQRFRVATSEKEPLG
jgi:Rieske Fe-S protein